MHSDDRPDGVDVGRALKRLPQPRAPRTLLPRVMAAAEARAALLPAAAPSRKRAALPWVAWPVGWQLASVVVLSACAIGLARLWPGAEVVIGSSLAPITERLAAVAVEIADRTSVVLTVARVLRALVHAVAGYALVVVFVMFVMGAACATFGAALNRVAVGGHS